jgi:hypothetical protein
MNKKPAKLEKIMWLHITNNVTKALNEQYEKNLVSLNSY